MRIAYFTQLKKYGNAIVLTVPKEIRAIEEIEIGDYVRVEVEKVE